MSKVILIDCSVLSFKAAFNTELMVKNNRGSGNPSPSHYTYFSSVIACLKKVHVGKDDIVVLCIDDKSWRKDFYSPYKANRKEAREKHIIDWDKHWYEVDKINKQLEYATHFHLLKVPKCEADDIFAVACRVFTDKQIVICSIDSDLHQLCYYPNVLMFNLKFKTSKGNGGYVSISKEEALKILAKKVRLGDKSDNIIVDKNEDEGDAELRRSIINLLELPEFVEKPIAEALRSLPNKSGVKWDAIPFQNSLAERFEQIYDPKYKIEPEYCYALKAKREEKKKQLAKEKRLLKKQLKQENKNVD